MTHDVRAALTPVLGQALPSMMAATTVSIRGC
jgi:hypothetical protein